MTMSQRPLTRHLDRIPSLELARVTERAAIAAARLRGRGDEMAADQAAAATMHEELARLAVEGVIAFGEGSRDEAPLLYTGEKIGRGGPRVDIAVEPLEGTTVCAKNQANALAVVALAGEGGLLVTPAGIYMDKIAIGPGYPAGIVDLDAPPAENILALADAKRVPVSDITACILDRPRHSKLIEAVRATGCAIRLIGDGDVAAVIHTSEPAETGIDIYLGSGGAREGVLAAAALRCTGGQFQGRLILDSAEKVARAAELGLDDPKRIYGLDGLIRGEVLFAATGVTDGNMLAGVRFGRDRLTTHTVVMRSSTGTVRWIRATHRLGETYDAE
jgi:fructose-1,6-bisphosphatase II / sedoheptulose-1,7-bisphosphatase